MNPKEILIKIMSLFESSGTDEAQTGLDDVTTAAGEAGDAAEEAGDKTGQAGEEMRRAGEEASGAATEFTGLADESAGAGEAAQGAEMNFAAVTATLAAVTAALAGAAGMFREFAGAQRVISDLDTVLANSGQATEGYRQRLHNLADELQRTTAIADSEWLEVMTRLTQFGADSTNIEQYTEAVKNMAGFLGGDARQAAFMFGRVMEGNTEMLTRYGITVDRTKEQHEILDDVMRQLAERGGGLLENRARTLGGQMSGLTEEVLDLAKHAGALGDEVLDVTGAIGFWRRALVRLNDAVAQPIGSTVRLGEAARLQGLSAEEAAELTDKHNAALDEMRQKADAATQALDDMDRARQQQLARERELLSLQQQAELAAVDADETLTDEQRAQRRAEIVAEGRRREHEMEREALEEGVRQRQQALEEAARAEEQLREQIAERRAAVEEARERAEAAQVTESEFVRGRRRVEELQRRAQQARDAARGEDMTDAERRTMELTGVAPGRRRVSDEDAARHNAEADRLFQQADRAMAHLQQMARDDRDAQQVLETLEQELKGAADDEDDRGLIGQLELAQKLREEREAAALEAQTEAQARIAHLEQVLALEEKIHGTRTGQEIRTAREREEADRRRQREQAEREAQAAAREREAELRGRDQTPEPEPRVRGDRPIPFGPSEPVDIFGDQAAVERAGEQAEAAVESLERTTVAMMGGLSRKLGEFENRLKQVESQSLT